MPRILTQADIASFRDRLCDVATQLYAEVGHAGFNMRGLAQRVGVSAMTPYRYFRDKDEILDLLRERAFVRLTARLEAAACTADTPEARHTAIVRAYLRFALEEETSYRLMFDLTRRGSALAGHEERRILALLSGMQDGDAVEAGWITWSALHGAIGMYLAGNMDAARVTRLVEAFVNSQSSEGDGAPIWHLQGKSPDLQRSAA